MTAKNNSGPHRIVCLTEETTETLYLLGEEHRIVGISGYTCRPKEARQQKPKVSAFTSAKIEMILELRPDLVIGFSDLQAAIAQDLIRAGVNVLVFNQRSVEEILDVILMLARIVAAEGKGIALVSRLRGELTQIAESARRFPRRPRVFFEEWMDPLISGIRWVDELMELAGGEPCFPNLRDQHGAKERILEPGAVLATNPEVVIASWCGRKVSKDQIRARDGWAGMSAVRSGHIYEIKSTYILQPGPAALTEGVRQLHAILAHVAECEPPTELLPLEALDPDLRSGGSVP
ncbi:MAG TPA: ABC transporter substrate-binding protein [Candidatus Acidoferrum sp.]|nr:ABC transporter substrate-binding protein [Candidatus Acidoferrum sp.]